MLIDWKKEYGEVFASQLEDFEFYFRLLTYKEYILLNEQAHDAIDLDESICRLCVLSPIVDDWSDEIFAGYTSTLGRLIREESLISSREDGSGNIKELISNGLEEIDNQFLLQMPAIICHAFPHYSIQEVEELSLRQQVDLYIKAAWTIKQFEGINLEFEE